MRSRARLGDLWNVTASADGFWAVGAGGVASFAYAAALEKAPEVKLRPVAKTKPLEDEVRKPRADPLDDNDFTKPKLYDNLMVRTMIPPGTREFQRCM